MSLSENSFVDRLKKSRDLQAAVATLVPVFAPADVSLSAAAFFSQIATVALLNTALDGPKTVLADAILARVADTKTTKTLLTQLVAFVKSNSVWKSKYPRIKDLADKVRGFKPPRKAPLPGPTPAPKPRDRGDGSYAEIAANFTALVSALGTLSGFNPPDNAIKLITLQPLAGRLATNNVAVATADQEVAEAQRNRFAGYYGPGGLKERFAAIKTAVKGQYGQNSPQWGQVKGIRW